MPCPCCGGESAASTTPLPHEACLRCGHRYRGADPDGLRAQYSAQGPRNPGQALLGRKSAERLAALQPLLRPGSRVLEIGCAEGELGRQVKARLDVHYTGVELSADRDAARRVLDRVIDSAAALPNGACDLVLAFHVLEHLANPAAEAALWRRVLAPDGRLVVEVPNASGNPLLAFDASPEHLHQFTAASLAALLGRAGFELERLDTGHFESPLYPDSLRVVAHRAPDPVARRRLLLERLRARLPGEFAVYGLGGDFRNYVLPLLAELPVAALLDSDRARHGERIGALTVEAFDRARHGALPILVASLAHGDAIRAALSAAGMPRERTVGLEEIYGA